MFASKYKSSFVASGSTQGDLSARATVVMPKVQTGRALAPPPVPIVQQPLYLRRQQQGFAAPQSGTESASVQQVRLPLPPLHASDVAALPFAHCNLGAQPAL
jgi:hypothetical protein